MVRDFFSNRSVTYLNIHNGFVELLNQTAIMFGLIFLYQQGFSVAQVFLTFGIMMVGRILGRFCSLPLMKAIGLRKTVATGLMGYGAAIITLSQVHGLDGWLLLYMLLYMLFNPMYWFAFHIYYTLTSEERHRGKQYAVRSTIVLSGQALFPLISAACIKFIGYHSYFFIAIPITCAALAFLLLCDDIPIPAKSWGRSRGQFFCFGVRTSFFNSFYDFSVNTLWLFAVYFFLDGKMLQFGSVMAFGIIVQILWQLLVGFKVDNGHARRVANIGGVTMIVAIFGRIFMPLSIPIILALEMINSTARLHVRSVNDISTYNDSHRTTHIIWYWVFTEITRDTGTILGSLSVALLLYSGFPVREAIFIGLPAFLMFWNVLVNHLPASRHAHRAHEMTGQRA